MSPSVSHGEWIVRPYRPGDEGALVALFQRAFQRTITEAHWRWKLKQLPTPVENVWLAVAGERVIAQYASIPVRYRLPQGERVLMVGADVMTAPEYRRRGLFTGLAQLAYETWHRAGIPLTIGLPNEQWGSRKALLGWTELFPLQYLVRPLRPERVLARRLNVPILGRLAWPGAWWNRRVDRRLPEDATIQVRGVSEAGPEFDRLWETCGADIELSTVRDAAWVRWRYLSAPSFEYQVRLAERSGRAVGYAAFRIDESRGRRVGAIAEVFTSRSDTGARQTLIRRVVEEIRSMGAEQAVNLAVPGTPTWQAFRAAGFLPRHRFTVEVNRLDPAVPLDLLRDRSHWSMAGSDFDVI